MFLCIVGNLHILSVTDEDWDGQQYGCGLWNELTKTFTKGSMTSLSIKGQFISFKDLSIKGSNKGSMTSLSIKS